MTTETDLKSDDGLRTACLDPELVTNTAEVADWVQGLATDIAWVREADEETRATRDFQWRLWEENRVAALGQGNVLMDQVIDDPEFREWIARRSLEPCPPDTSGRIDFLTGWYHGLRDLLRDNHAARRTPHVKIFRVLALLYPESMTTIAAPDRLEALTRRMGGDDLRSRAARHAWVRGRLDEVLGPAADDATSQAERLVLPWLLYQKYVGLGVQVEDGELRPLPADQRFKGLTGTRGMFDAMRSTLAFVGEGVTRQELLAYLAKASPDAKASSLAITINGLRSEFGVARKDGGRIVLTDRGRELVETGDPDVLADWLLMRVLGPDWLLLRLRDGGPLPLAHVAPLLRQVNPGWTTGGMPNNIRAWLTSLGVVQTEAGALQLTERGQRWAARITCQPEAIARPEAPTMPTSPPPPSPPAAYERVVLPPVEVVFDAVEKAGHFPVPLVAQLHAGLWAHPRRHFAVLTGLSGAGKTLLARSYAAGLTSGPAGGASLTLPVQPGWHDPGALLGYVNPLRGETYVRTPCLEFLLQAAGSPEAPHLLLLDEMNLSHPEQYMAPLLSAMETGDAIHLHTEDEYLDGVPAMLPYPSNLVIIGTVNMDETTHGLSDKVLDRAFVVEFWDVELASYPHWQTDDAPLQALLGGLMAALAPARLHFGFRIVDEVRGFMRRATHGGHLSFSDALDAVVYAKVLPKLRGEDMPRLRRALAECARVLDEYRLPRSADKVRELEAELLATGSTRFWR